MPNELNLDSAEFQEMVGQWQNGGRYYVTLNITQNANDGKNFKATVDSVEDYGDLEAETEEEMPMKEMPMKKKMMKSPAKVMVNAKGPTTTY